jgi:hypothetical protein
MIVKQQHTYTVFADAARTDIFVSQTAGNDRVGFFVLFQFDDCSMIEYRSGGAVERSELQIEVERQTLDRKSVV